MWNLVSVRLEIVLVSVQYRCTVCTECTLAQKSFWTHPVILLGDEVQVEACLSSFGDSGNLTQDRCAVCAKRTIGSEIVVNAPDGSPRGVGHVESRFGPFGDSVSVGAI
jgi:hypothetical protein